MDGITEWLHVAYTRSRTLACYSGSLTNGFSGSSCTNWTIHEQGVARYYTVLGQPVCGGGFTLLWGVWNTRIRAVYNTVAEGNPSSPVDLRYLKKVQSRCAQVLSWTTSFLEEAYESVAETLPDSLNDVDSEWWEDVLGQTPLYDPGQVACLPHGCIYEHWQTYNTMYPDARSWRASWSYKLRLRGQSQHTACQIELLSEHRLDQYKDRRFYWGIHAKSWSLMTKSRTHGAVKAVVKLP